MVASTIGYWDESPPEPPEESEGVPEYRYPCDTCGDLLDSQSTDAADEVHHYSEPCPGYGPPQCRCGATERRECACWAP